MLYATQMRKDTEEWKGRIKKPLDFEKLTSICKVNFFFWLWFKITVGEKKQVAYLLLLEEFPEST